MDPFSSLLPHQSKNTVDNPPPPVSASSTTTSDTHQPRPPSLPSKTLSNSPQLSTSTSTPLSPFQQQTPLPIRQASPNSTLSHPNPNSPPSRPIRSPTTSTPLRTATPQKSPLTASSTKPELHHNKLASNPSKSLNRPVGLAALSAQSQKSARFASHGTNLRRANAEALATQFTTFQRQLHEFSIKHGAEIRQNAQFRGEFAKMCAALGVDPLAAAVEGAKAKAKAGAGAGAGREKDEKKEGEKEREKGIAGLKGLFWERVGRKGESRTQDKSGKNNDDNDNDNANLYDPNYDHDHDNTQASEDGEDQGLSAETKHHLAEMLGGSINQFYWELGLRIIQIVIETRTENGGLIELAELKRRVRWPFRRGKDLGRDVTAENPRESENESPSGFGSGLDVSEQDIIQAIHSLAPLGPGYTIITIRRTRFLRSVPREFNPDQTTVLAVMQLLGYATVSMLRANLDWSAARAYAVLQDLVVDSVAWVDREEGVFWETGSAEDIDGYVGGVWEDRYWAASWMYKRRDNNKNNDYHSPGKGVVNDGIHEEVDEQEHAVPRNRATALAEAQGDGDGDGDGDGKGEGKVKAKDNNPIPQRDRPRPEPNESTASTTTATATATATTSNVTNMNKYSKIENPNLNLNQKENDNDDTSNTNIPDFKTTKVKNRIDDDEDDDVDDEDDEDDEDEDPIAFEERQNRIKAELKAFLEARIAEDTFLSGTGTGTESASTSASASASGT